MKEFHHLLGLMTIVLVLFFTAPQASFCLRMNFGSVAKSIAQSDAIQGGLPNVALEAGNFVTLAKYDYTKPPRQVARETGDAIIGIVAAGLTFIPGVGPILGGLVSGIWSIMSGLFLADTGPSPMEQMINDLRDEMKKHVDQKLKNVIDKAIGSEIRRNEYVCEKYAILTRDFANQLKTHKKIKESLRIEMVAMIEDCDNFLRDTADAFVHPEYADLLWIASVTATMMRVSFLTEITNYAATLDIDKRLVALFLNEIKADLKRHFQFFGDAVKQRAYVQNGNNYSEIEYQSCKIQSELLYLDRELYPHGIPKQVLISDENTEIKLADYHKGNSGDPMHLQVLQNTFRKEWKSNQDHEYLNCILGSVTQNFRLSMEKVRFNVVYIPNRQYIIRVLYFIRHEYFEPSGLDDDKLFTKEITKTTDCEILVDQPIQNHIRIFVTLKKESDNNRYHIDENDKQFRFVFKTGMHKMRSTVSKSGHSSPNTAEEEFLKGNSGVKGAFVLENVSVFQVDTRTKGSIAMEVNEEDERKEHYAPLVGFGIEIIQTKK